MDSKDSTEKSEHLPFALKGEHEEQINKQITGTWIEKNSDCEAKLVFGPNYEFQMLSPNSKAKGSYRIMERVVVPSGEFCKVKECFAIKYKLKTTEKEVGCNDAVYSLEDEFDTIQFHIKDKNTIVYWEHIEFSRMQ